MNINLSCKPGLICNTRASARPHCCSCDFCEWVKSLQPCSKILQRAFPEKSMPMVFGIKYPHTLSGPTFWSCSVSVPVHAPWTPDLVSTLRGSSDLSFSSRKTWQSNKRGDESSSKSEDIFASNRAHVLTCITNFFTFRHLAGSLPDSLPLNPGFCNDSVLLSSSFSDSCEARQQQRGDGWREALNEPLLWDRCGGGGQAEGEEAY